MTPLFLDTGYIIALELSDDQHHGAVVEHWNDFRNSLPPLVTTSYVVAETVTFFNSRRHHAKAVETGNRLLESPSIELIQVDDALFHDGWDFFQQHDDKTYSMTDCISFVVMGQRGIASALTTDRHFEQAGFLRLPSSP